MDPELAALREDYERGGLSEAEVGPEPIPTFRRWFEQARAAGVYEPNAMVLATVSTDGQPSARAVLLKEIADEGFVFYTNHDSRKGHELAARPACALTFTWLPLHRQVRIEGTAVALPRKESSAYFATRPRDSQLGAWASAQSSVVAGREELEATYAEAVRRYDGRDVPCPPYWGGYCVRPHRVEFWQGRHGRMHDRLVYERRDDHGAGWSLHRLAP